MENTEQETIINEDKDEIESLIGEIINIILEKDREL
jgi:hypothetical protein